MTRIHRRLFVAAAALTACAAAGVAHAGSCTDPWVTQVVVKYTGHYPWGPRSPQCNINLYRNGHWANFGELDSAAAAYWSVTGDPEPIRYNGQVLTGAQIRQAMATWSTAAGFGGVGLVINNRTYIIGSNSAGVVGPAAGSLLSTNGGNVIAAGGGNLVIAALPVGTVIAAGGGNVIAAGGGNVRSAILGGGGALPPGVINGGRPPPQLAPGVGGPGRGYY